MVEYFSELQKYFNFKRFWPAVIDKLPNVRYSVCIQYEILKRQGRQKVLLLAPFFKRIIEKKYILEIIK